MPIFTIDFPNQDKPDKVVAFRNGGTENFQWHRSVRVGLHAAIHICENVRRGGRPAYVVEADTPLPQSFYAVETVAALHLKLTDRA